MKFPKKVIFPLLTLSLLGGTAAYADSIGHTLSGVAGTTATYHSYVSDNSYDVEYGYNHSDEIYEYGSNKIKFTKAKVTNGESNPAGAEFYNYQIVDVYGGGAGTKTQALGTEVEDGFSLITGVTLYSTATKSAFTRTLVCADPSGCAGGQQNWVYDSWVYSPPSSLKSNPFTKNEDEIQESKQFEIIEDRTLGQKVTLKAVKEKIDFVEPKYVPSFLVQKDDVIFVEPPKTVVDKDLKDKLNQWEIRYGSTVDNSFINLTVTKGGNGILGETEAIEINGKKAEIQESGKLITLAWKHEGISYWLLARTTDALTKEEVLKFANSID